MRRFWQCQRLCDTLCDARNMDPYILHLLSRTTTCKCMIVIEILMPIPRVSGCSSNRFRPDVLLVLHGGSVQTSHFRRTPAGVGSNLRRLLRLPVVRHQVSRRIQTEPKACSNLCFLRLRAITTAPQVSKIDCNQFWEIYWVFMKFILNFINWVY